MNIFDVIVVGGGPAGLRCAEVLASTEMSVLLLEKGSGFGEKICAGGLTRKDMLILQVPLMVIEHAITDTGLFSPRQENHFRSPGPIAFTVNRRAFGEWHRERIKSSNVRILTNARVTSVKEDCVIVNEQDTYGYRYLVGADGYNSLVRKHLGFSQQKRLIGIQYRVPNPDGGDRFEIHFHSRYFKAWYAWIFPHKDTYAIGCCADPARMSSEKLKKNFHRWFIQKGFDAGNAIYESAPISYDFRGIQFGNIFLAGDAAGIGSCLTGEGIYQSLVSGETAARLIIDPDYDSEALKKVIRYNRSHERIMKFLLGAGFFRAVIYESLILLLKNKRLRMRINNFFS